MHIEASNTFIKLYRKLDNKMKKQVKNALICLKNNPFHPSLGNKKINSQKSIYEIRVSKNYRITYTKIKNVAILRKVGNHDVLNKP